MHLSCHFFLVAVSMSIIACTQAERAPSRIARKGSTQRHLTTGVQTRDNASHPHVRHEVRDMAQHYPDQWALYLLGLLRFQQVDQSDPLSYYRISGIHARPYEIWQDGQGIPGARVGAYCPHISKLFLTWHRPYLALFEQELWKHVRAVADTAVNGYERWSAAANAFRIPYWDTASAIENGNIPQFLLSPRWPINGPNGFELIDNPLFWYQFRPLAEGEFGSSYVANYSQTLRWPTTRSADAKPQLGLWQKDYLKSQRNRQDYVHVAFQETASFNNFSLNLENAHSTMHIITGGDVNDTEGLFHGHMWEVDFSAFDPVFMLHHANVDRLMALYTAANPDVWLEPLAVNNVNNMATFWIPRNATTDENYPLPPFWKDEETFYTSADIRNTESLGYVYPETQYWNFASKEDWQGDVKKTIQLLYPNSAVKRLTNAKATGAAFKHILDEGNAFIDWTLEVKVSANEMPSTFNIVFFLSSKEYSGEAIQIGVWTRSMPESHEMHPQDAPQGENKRSSTIEMTSSSTMMLTSSLLDGIVAGDLENLNPDAVIPFLTARLTWVLSAGTNLERVSDSYLSSFSVEVTSTKVRIPNDPSQALEYTSISTTYPMKRLKDNTE